MSDAIDALIEKVAFLVELDETKLPLLETYVRECIEQTGFTEHSEPGDVADMFLADCSEFLDVFV